MEKRDLQYGHTEQPVDLLMWYLEERLPPKDLVMIKGMMHDYAALKIAEYRALQKQRD